MLKKLNLIRSGRIKNYQRQRKVKEKRWKTILIEYFSRIIIKMILKKNQMKLHTIADYFFKLDKKFSDPFLFRSLSSYS